MKFPQTRKTLISRIVADGNERDWQQFLNDYWLCVCRFAQYRAHLSIEDAEDVASETFEALLRNKLLSRWAADRSSKLRTLLCTVVRHILGNRARVQKGRQCALAEKAAELLARNDLPTIRGPDAEVEYLEEFYTAWVQSVLLTAVESLMQEYHRTGRGDYFRVLHGRICEQMTAPQIATALAIKTTDAENYYRAARKRLTDKLQELVLGHTRRYCRAGEAEDEFDSEWNRIGEYLKNHGGLEQAIARVYSRSDMTQAAQRQPGAITATLKRLTASMQAAGESSR